MLKTIQTLVIEPTTCSPKVILDPVSRFFIIEGECRPENSEFFFRPVIKWLNDYKLLLSSRNIYSIGNKSIILQFKLDYFNCSSAKYIHDILGLFNCIGKEGYEVSAMWFYKEGDIDIKESGDIYMKSLKNLSAKLVLVDLLETGSLEHQYLYN